MYTVTTDSNPTSNVDRLMPNHALTQWVGVIEVSQGASLGVQSEHQAITKPSSINLLGLLVCCRHALTQWVGVFEESQGFSLGVYIVTTDSNPTSYVLYHS